MHTLIRINSTRYMSMYN